MKNFDLIFINNRVCPMPIHWNKLYNMLPNTKRVDGHWVPALPLILSAWWEVSDNQKRTRFVEHLDWAKEYGIFDEIIKFLNNLDEKDWHHEQSNANQNYR